MEHKKFFVKDFIQYASPCFGCGGTPKLRVVFIDKNPDPVGQHISGNITPVVTDNHIEIDLSIRYGSHLRLWILPKLNQFLTNDDSGFSNHIVKRDLYLATECSCGTRFETDVLHFQTFNKVISPTTLRYEYILIQEKDTKYILYSNFRDEKSKATVCKLKYSTGSAINFSGVFVKGPVVTGSDDISFTLPLLAKYKLRDKQHLIDKLRIYTIFS